MRKRLASEDCNPTAIPDEALVAAAIRDRQAFSPLYERYAARVYRYALARTGSEEVAEDVLGETMLAAIEGLAKWNPRRGTFAGWLFTIATRRIVDGRRRAGRQRQHVPREHPTPDPDDNPLTAAVRADDVARLRDALAELPEDDRDLILMRYSAELSSAEIGTVLGISAGAARTRLSRLLDRLARDLGES